MPANWQGRVHVRSMDKDFYTLDCDVWQNMRGHTACVGTSRLTGSGRYS